MPRSFSLLFMAALVGAGWYFFRGPGVEQLDKYLPARPGYGQAGAPGGYPQYPPQYSGATYPGGDYSGGAAQPVLQPAPPAAGYAAAGYAGGGGAAPVLVGQAASPLAAGPTIRIASYNIQVFGDAKASRPEVMWTLAAILQNFHIIAIQEIRTQDVYFLTNFVREYVNARGRAYDYVIGPRLGRSTSKEQYAYIYDTAAIELNRQSVYTVNDPDDLLHREPLVAMFRARGPPPQDAFTFILVNTHTDPDETGTEIDTLGQVYQVVRRTAYGEDDIILLGDFNVDERRLEQLGGIPGLRPVVRGVFTNTRQSALYDNMLLHQPSTTEFTGRWGVYDVERLHGLTREQALMVSDHLPIWAEFSAYESAGPGRMASRPEATIRAQ